MLHAHAELYYTLLYWDTWLFCPNKFICNSVTYSYKFSLYIIILSLIFSTPGRGAGGPSRTGGLDREPISRRLSSGDSRPGRSRQSGNMRAWYGAMYVCSHGTCTLSMQIMITLMLRMGHNVLHIHTLYGVLYVYMS